MALVEVWLAWVSDEDTISLHTKIHLQLCRAYARYTESLTQAELSKSSLPVSAGREDNVAFVETRVSSGVAKVVGLL